MGIFRKHKPEPSTTAQESLNRARQDLEEQLAKHDDTVKAQKRIERALERNGLAELMYEALSAKREH